jgi:hypothetical protein
MYVNYHLYKKPNTASKNGIIFPFSFKTPKSISSCWDNAIMHLYVTWRRLTVRLNYVAHGHTSAEITVELTDTFSFSFNQLFFYDCYQHHNRNTIQNFIFILASQHTLVRWRQRLKANSCLWDRFGAHWPPSVVIILTSMWSRHVNTDDPIHFLTATLQASSLLLRLLDFKLVSSVLRRFSSFRYGVNRFALLDLNRGLEVTWILGER